MKHQLLFLFLITFTIVGCDTAEKPINNETVPEIFSEEWKEVTMGKFHTHIPEEWVVEKAKKQREFILYAPKTSKDDKFREKIDLKTQPLPSSIKKIEDYAYFRKNKLDGTLEKQSEIEIKKDFRDGRDYFILEYAGETSGYDLKFEERIWIDKDQVHILTFTAENNQFDKYQPNAHKVMNGIME